jgi:hypothetical protein
MNIPIKLDFDDHRTIVHHNQKLKTNARQLMIRQINIIRPQNGVLLLC